MTLYLWLKLLHILSSTILFGTGIRTACNLWLAHKTQDTHIIATTARYVVLADYFRYFRYWFCLGWPAFISLIIVFYLMTNKPM